MRVGLRRGWFAACVLMWQLAGCGGRHPASTPLAGELRIEAPVQVEPWQAARLRVAGLAAAEDVGAIWTFGDGGTSTEREPSHAWTRPGEYPIAITLRNAAGESRELNTTLRVGRWSLVSGRDCSGGGNLGWCRLQPRPTPVSIAELRFIDARRGVAVGEVGTVLTSADGGASWVRQRGVGERGLGLLRATAAGELYAISAQGPDLWKSADAGVSWSPLGTVPLREVRELWALPQGRLVASGLDAALGFRTWASEDDGRNWRSILASSVSGSGVVWLQEVESLATSYDFGRSFTTTIDCAGRCMLVTKSLGDDGDVRVITSRLGIADGQPWTLHRSADAGRSWTRTEIAVPGASLIMLPVIYPGGKGWAVADIAGTEPNDGLRRPRLQVWRSADDGSAWEPVGEQAIPAEARLPAEPFIDGDSLWLALDEWAIATTDRGRSWRALRVSGERSAPKVVRRSVQGSWWLGFGDAYRIDRWYSSADDGASWTPLPGGQRDEDKLDLAGLWFFDANKGLALLGDGSLRASDDGGRSWIAKPLDAPAFNFAQSFELTRDGSLWLLGGGQLRVSDDAGASWTRTALPLPGDRFVKSVQAIDRTTAWIAADRCEQSGNTIFCDTAWYLTRDRGRTLAPVPEITPVAGPRFFDALLGVAKHALGVFQHTTDGGKTWVTSQSDREMPSAANRLYFRNAAEVWMLPKYGDALVMRSTDGGRSWRTVELPSGSANLYDIAFADDQTGWMVGSAGLVLATRDGGASWQRQRTGTERSLVKVFALDAMTAWIVGEQGTVLATASGGR